VLRHLRASCKRFPNDDMLPNFSSFFMLAPPETCNGFRPAATE
jgi:hypothetical protein